MLLGHSNTITNVGPRKRMSWARSADQASPMSVQRLLLLAWTSPAKLRTVARRMLVEMMPSARCWLLGGSLLRCLLPILVLELGWYVWSLLMSRQRQEIGDAQSRISHYMGFLCHRQLTWTHNLLYNHTTNPIQNFQIVWADKHPFRLQPSLHKMVRRTLGEQGCCIFVDCLTETQYGSEFGHQRFSRGAAGFHESVNVREYDTLHPLCCINSTYVFGPIIFKQIAGHAL